MGWVEKCCAPGASWQQRTRCLWVGAEGLSFPHTQAEEEEEAGFQVKAEPLRFPSARRERHGVDGGLPEAPGLPPLQH